LDFGPVAQLVEPQTFNLLVVGSIPTRPIMKTYRTIPPPPINRLYKGRKLTEEEKAALVKDLEQNQIRDKRVLLKNVGDFHKGKRRLGYRTAQQGIISFGRKKKNGCRLISTADILRQERISKDEMPGATNCRNAFPATKLDRVEGDNGNHISHEETRQKWQVGDLAEILDERQKARTCIISGIDGDFATILMETRGGTEEIDVLVEDLF
jgi:hypothetical protein